MSNLVTIKQAAVLHEIGYKKPTIRYAYNFDGKFILQRDVAYVKVRKFIKLVLPVPTVDEVIDWFRSKYQIIICNHVEPYVDPVSAKITYIYKVKRCNTKWGWNHREYISRDIKSTDINAVKRMAIWAAIRYIKNQQKDAKNRRQALL
jgi:hypothetical protein